MEKSPIRLNAKYVLRGTGEKYLAQLSIFKNTFLDISDSVSYRACRITAISTSKFRLASKISSFYKINFL